MPRVLNRKHGDMPDDAIYVGRPTKFGNPFMIGVHGSRDKVVELYRDWIFEDTPEKAELRRSVKAELRGHDLVCWCAPQKCHAEVLLNLAN